VPKQTAICAKILAILAANSICQKRQRKCQREFYMAQSVLARIRTGAEKGLELDSGGSTQEFNGR
jgi:hypothetical protein